MGKDSALYQLMDVRMHSVMNGIVSSDGEYQAILRRSDIYSGELDRMDLSKEIRLLIDLYGNLPCADGFKTRLVDGHADDFDIIEGIEQFQSA